jgi:hypothetical protein
MFSAQLREADKLTDYRGKVEGPGSKPPAKPGANLCGVYVLRVVYTNLS